MMITSVTGSKDPEPMGRGRLFAMAVMVTMVAVSLPAAASAAGADEQVAQLKHQVDDQRARLDAQAAELADMRHAIDVQAEIMRRAGLLDVAATRPNAPVATHYELVRNQAEPPATSSAPIATTSQPAPVASTEAERPRSERAADQLLVDAGGVLLPRWTLQVEPSTDWTHISNPRVNIAGFTVFNAIVIGTIRFDSVSRDIVNTAISARMGLPHRTQIDVRLPFTSRYDREILAVGTGDTSERINRTEHIGDAEATVSWQPIVENGWRPAVVLRTRFRFPTGESAFEIPAICTDPTKVVGGAGPDGCPSAQTTLKRAPSGGGFFAIEPGATFVWRSDPLVIFAGGAYSITPHATFPGRRINAGNTISFNAGLNFAVNERASLNASFSDQITPIFRVNGQRQLGTESNDARLGFGASFGITDHIALVLNSSIGLTDQAPGYTVSFSIPVTFPLRK